MYTRILLLNSIDKIVKFCKDTESLNAKISVNINNNYLTGNSLMTLFSLNMSVPHIFVFDGQDSGKVQEIMKEYEVNKL